MPVSEDKPVETPQESTPQVVGGVEYDASAIQVLEGLEANEAVISPLPARLRDGAPVTTQTAAASSEGAALEDETSADPT